MPCLTRRVLGAVAVSVALAAPARAAEVDKLLPADTEFVVQVNVRQALDSELVKKYAIEQIKQAMAGNDAQKALKALGLDPLKDIDRVTIGGYGTDPKDMKALAVIRCKFDPEKLSSAAEAHAQKDPEKLMGLTEGGVTLYKMTQENQPNPSYGAIRDGSTLLFGSTKELVLDGVAGKGGGVKRELAALVLKQDEAASVYLCGVTAGKLGNLPLPGGNDPAMKKNLENMANMALTLRVTTDVNLEVVLGMKDEDAADEFGKIVDQGVQQAKGIIPFLAAQNPQMKPLTELAQTLKNSTKNKDVVITAKLSGDSIGKMLNMGE